LIVLEVDAPEGLSVGGSSDAVPGTVLSVDNKRFVVQTGSGPLEIDRLQPEGKRAMTAAEFLVGYPVRPGDRFEN
jgi:methionyl-tRNA formyltransferase